jgi:hypothetical protein
VAAVIIGLTFFGPVVLDVCAANKAGVGISSTGRCVGFQ